MVLLEKTVRFYGPTGEFAPLDNFYREALLYEGQIYRTVEQAYQAAKFLPEFCDGLVDGSKSLARHLVFMQILSAKTPEGAWTRAQENKWLWYEDWDEEKKLLVMMRLCWAKWEQSLSVRSALKETGKRRIIQASRDDSFWGVGADGNGENWMGLIWEFIRKATANKEDVEIVLSKIRDIIGGTYELNDLRYRAARLGEIIETETLSESDIEKIAEEFPFLEKELVRQFEARWEAW